MKSFLASIIIFSTLLFQLGIVYAKEQPKNEPIHTNASIRIKLPATEVVGYYRNKDSGAKFVVSLVSKKKLKIKGLARYEGSSVHFGWIDGVVNFDGRDADYLDKESGCDLRLAFDKKIIIARDNNQCGGMNVTFNGTYKKIKVSRLPILENPGRP